MSALAESPRSGSLLAWRQRCLAGTATPTQWVETCLTRIERLDPQLRAWVQVFRDEALEAAAASTARFQQQTPRPLEGVPVGIKDIIDVEGVPTGQGVGASASHSTPSRSAEIVERLTRLGAIPLGKTVTTAWACFDPAPTANPWDEGATPGGSSSGSAAAVASDMVPLALGTQTGGSVIRPAAYCGIAGLKPTWNRFGLRGVFPVSPAIDTLGWMTREPDDLRTVWQALQEGDVETVTESDPEEPFTRVVLYPDSWGNVSEKVRQAVNWARSVAAERGLKIKSREFPRPWEEALGQHRRLMVGQLVREHPSGRHDIDSQRFPGLASLLVEGERVSDAELDAALAYQADLRHELRRRHEITDVVLSPSAPSAAPQRRDTTGDPRLNAVWTLVGWPAVTVPVPLWEGSLPLAAQWIALTDQEPRLLDWINLSIWARSTA